MVPLPEEVVENIKDFMNGTNRYWRKQYNKVVKDINNLKFFVFTEWSNEFCNLCRYNDCEFTIEIDYDEALKTYYQDMNKTFNFGCECIIKDCKILPVTDNYYVALDYYYPDDVDECILYNHEYYDLYYNYSNNNFNDEYFNYYDNYY